MCKDQDLNEHNINAMYVLNNAPITARKVRLGLKYACPLSIIYLYNYIMFIARIDRASFLSFMIRRGR